MTTHVAEASDRIQLKDPGQPAIRLEMPKSLVGASFIKGNVYEFERESNGLESNWFHFRGVMNGHLMFHASN